MTTDDYWKKCLEEAEIPTNDQAHAQKIVRHLRSRNESEMAHQPPAGYEDHLLAALRRQLPEEKKAPERSQRRASLWTGARAWGWTLGLTLATLSLVWVISRPSAVVPVAQEKNYLEWVGADESSAENWLATISDSGFRLANSHGDLSGMALQISHDEKLMKKVKRAIAQWKN